MTRGISLLIVLSGVIGLLAIIMFGLIPQLAGTFASLGKSIQDLSRSCRSGQIIGFIIIRRS